MPRSKPFRCHTCRALYTGARCPKCFPKKQQGSKRAGRRSGRRRSRRVGRTTAVQVLGRSLLPVNVDAVPEPDDDEGEDTACTNGC